LDLDLFSGSVATLVPGQTFFRGADDKMQAGYDAMGSVGVVAACRIWLDAWADVLRILDKAGLQSISDFDKRFRGTQSLFNWIQDLEGELWNAGLEDKQFLAARIALCEEGLKRFEATDDELMTENRRRALAESYFELGETEKAEALYREWLKTDPQWGWGWIGWSACYQFTRSELRNLRRAEQLLLEGLAVAEVRDAEDISERLADLYGDQRRTDEADDVQQHARLDSAVIRHTLKLSP
jgi:tetratricopeptide (TPR) repeat protein